MEKTTVIEVSCYRNIHLLSNEGDLYLALKRRSKPQHASIFKEKLSIKYDSSNDDADNQLYMYESEAKELRDALIELYPI